MTSKIAFLSDIHGNSPALQAVLADIQHEQCTKVFMLGDLINGVDLHGCVQILRTWSDTNKIELASIKGNAEAYLVTPDRNLLIQQSDVWDVDLLNLLTWWENHLSASDLEWIHSLPDTIRWNDSLLVHDSPMDRLAMEAQSEIPPQYRELNFHGRGILPNMADSDWQTLLAFMQSESIAQVFCGHTHRPFYKELDGYHICNIGSAGMPLDGDPRPSWALMTKNNSGEQSISIRRVTYDISSTLQLIDNTPDYYDFQTPGFQEAYKKMFLYGNYWRTYMPKNSSD
ncbi:MAG: metallophosphoesterase family protein [Anaerolineales bacterium]